MTEHHAALPYLQAPEFMASLRKVEGVAARALEFTILTCCRTMEVLGAKWDEFDFEAKTWTVPRQRMQKGGGRDADHKVPLCPRAIAILQGLPRLNDYVWPSTKANAGHLAANAMRPQLLALGYAVRVHGFRATFKTWAGETTNFPREVIEMCLAHQVAMRWSRPTNAATCSPSAARYIRHGRIGSPSRLPVQRCCHCANQ